MTNSNRGFAKMPKDRVREIARQGGKASPTKFEEGDSRARIAGKKGGLARSKDPDIRSGELGRKGAQARWERLNSN